mgnify:CR=1 FL=1
MIGRSEKNGPQGSGVNEDVCFTLDTADRHAVYAMTTSSFIQVEKNQSPVIMRGTIKIRMSCVLPESMPCAD